MKNRYLFFAFLASTGVVATLSACGEGLPFSLDGSPEMRSINEAVLDVEYNIRECFGKEGIAECPDVSKPNSSQPSAPSSSSEQQIPVPESSSSVEVVIPPVDESSSSEEISSSSESNSSSSLASSSSVAASSSSVAVSSSSKASSSSVAPSSSSSKPSSSSIAASSSSSKPSSSSAVVTPPPSGGGSADAPFEPPVGGGNLPGTADLEQLGGILYLHGYGASNQNMLRCNNTDNSNSYSVYYCDYYSGECEPTTKCAENTNQIACGLSVSFNKTPSFTGDCGHGGAECEYKVKLKFTSSSNSPSKYPGNCKIGN